jgi:hypothetical protein
MKKDSTGKEGNAAYTTTTLQQLNGMQYERWKERGKVWVAIAKSPLSLLLPSHLIQFHISIHSQQNRTRKEKKKSRSLSFSFVLYFIGFHIFFSFQFRSNG